MQHGTAAAVALAPRTAGRPDTVTAAAHSGRRRVLARSGLLGLEPAGSSARTARLSALAQLSRWDRGHLADDTAAIIAELMTNAVTASAPTGTPVGFSLILTESSVVIEVLDRAPGEPVPVTAAPDAESGRGLSIVAALSRQWGWTQLRDSKVVWAEVPA